MALDGSSCRHGVEATCRSGTRVAGVPHRHGLCGPLPRMSGGLSPKVVGWCWGCGWMLCDAGVSWLYGEGLRPRSCIHWLP
jgi:hypothetical protein